MLCDVDAFLFLVYLVLETNNTVEHVFTFGCYFMFNHIVSHFSSAPLIKCNILGKEIGYFYSETTSVKRIYVCMIHRKLIVIGPETNEKIDPEGHSPQNTNSHCFISNYIQITLYYFQCRISGMPYFIAALFVAI